MPARPMIRMATAAGLNETSFIARVPGLNVGDPTCSAEATAIVVTELISAIPRFIVGFRKAFVPYTYQELQVACQLLLVLERLWNVRV